MKKLKIKGEIIFFTKKNIHSLLFRRKFNARINEVQEQLTEVLAKASNLEKTKQRLQGELDKLNGDLEKVINRNLKKFFSNKSFLYLVS
jgi:predicted nuclease with TOPRIM domain